jgi:ribose-phosphate pyrophosphokinase
MIHDQLPQPMGDNIMNLHGKDIKIFSASSVPEVSGGIATNLGLPLGKSTVAQFADGEVSMSIGESVRGSDVFVVQSTCKPVNDHMLQLLIMIDAFKRASAGRITAVIPYFGYARQDRKARSRDPISAKLMADLITVAGADRVLTMDLHAPQIQGFFNIPVDHLLGVPILAPYFCSRFPNTEEVVVVSPDLGSVGRARRFAEKFDASIAIVDKRRPRANVSEVVNIIGDVRGKTVILVDDMVDTAGTLCNAASALMDRGGAKEVYACATHGLFNDPAIERIQNSPIKELVVLDTVPLPPEKRIDKIKVLPVAPVFAEAIERIYEDKPVSPLFV